KNFACYNLAQHATGDILLFLDADVEVRNGLIERALTHLQKHNIHLLSIFPQQHLKSAGEKISVPLMNWILLTLLPLFLIRASKNPAFSAANGQFMMFRADTYKKTQPHKEFRYHKVEDIATQRYLKKLGYKCDTLVGNEFIQCRMYEGLKDAINGFTKNIFEFFGNSILLTIVISITITIAPIIVFAYFGVFIGVLYVFGMILVRVFVSLTSKQPVFQNILVMIPQHTIFLVIILKGVVNYKRKELLWKGRNVFLD
ncbi:MAG: glycosyltransferase, partial [Bacteroidales bacterium]|nr:glycosyltransferase [Bacteroidales bacterium]